MGKMPVLIQLPGMVSCGNISTESSKKKVLVDLAQIFLGTIILLRNCPTYSLSAGSKPRPSRLRLVMGEAANRAGGDLMRLFSPSLYHRQQAQLMWCKTH